MNNVGRSVSSAHSQNHYLTSKHSGYSKRVPLDYKATCTLGDRVTDYFIAYGIGSRDTGETNKNRGFTIPQSIVK
jgi:hypothetical protein